MIFFRNVDLCITQTPYTACSLFCSYGNCCHSNCHNQLDTFKGWNVQSLVQDYKIITGLGEETKHWTVMRDTCKRRVGWKTFVSEYEVRKVLQ